MKFIRRRVAFAGALEPVNAWELIRSDMEPVAILGPARSGKTTAIMAPALMTWQGCAIVTDVHGELLRTTAKVRQERLGNRVRHIDFFNADSPDAFNFLSMIDIDDSRALENIRALSGIILEDQHAGPWKDRAEEMLSLFLIDGVLRKNSCMFDIFKDVSDELRFDSTISHYWNMDSPSNDLERAACEAAVVFAQLDTNSQFLLRSGLPGCLRIFSDEAVAKTTAKSTFKIADLFASESPTTCYLTFSPCRMEDFKYLARLFLFQVVSFGKRSRGSNSAHPLLLALDDLVTLRRLKFLEDDFCNLKQYGIKPLLAIQNLSALNAVYGTESHIWRQCKLRVILRINDATTAVAVAEELFSSDLSYLIAPKKIVDQGKLEAVILMLMSLGQWEAVILDASLKPVRRMCVPYFEDVEFSQAN